MNCCIINHDFIENANLLVLIITAFVLFLTLKAIKKSNEENARLNRLQAAENTIIKQIEFHYQLLNGIKFQNKIGQSAFEFLYNELNRFYMTMSGFYEPNVHGEEKRIKESFTALYKAHGSQFGHYFKNLYLLISYIDNVNVKDFKKHYHIELVKSQLSKYEILLLAYDCIWIQNKPKGKNFIEFARDHNLLTALERAELIKSVSNIQHLDIFREKYGIKFDDPIDFEN